MGLHRIIMDLGESIMYCKYCGKELPQNSHSCPNCGNSDELKSITIDISKSQESVVKPKVSFIRKELGRILLSIAILISLFFTHKILTYFFADYYNPSNYNNEMYNKYGLKYLGYNDHEANNYKRKNNSYKFFPSEHFYAKDIGTKVSDGDKSTSAFKFSSDVKLISRYLKDGFDDYDYHYNSISTFDISEMMREYSENEVYSYNTIMGKFDLALKTEPYNSQHTTIDGYKAIVFYMNKERSTKQLITCANKRLYFIETHSRNKLDHYFDTYCSQIRFKPINSTNNLIFLFSSMIVIYILILSTYLYLYRKKLMKNRFAFSLFVVSVVSFITNFAIATIQAYGLFNNYDATDMSVLILAGALLTSVCVAMPLTIFYIKASKQNWSRDYKVPSFLRTLHYNRLKNDMQRGKYTSYVCYPLMVLSLLPFGICIVTLYCVPLLILWSIIVSYQKWQSWVKGSI